MTLPAPSRTPTRPAVPRSAPIDEASRRRALRKMQWVANGMLVVAVIILLVAHYYEASYHWLAYVRATAEASVIGGLADWFAVTAIFRHPMGIPIPHTGIVPKQKDRIGRILGNFVQNHFLARSVLERRLSGVRPSERLTDWLDDETHRRTLSHQLAGGLARTVEALPGDKVRAIVHDQALTRLREVPLAPIMGDILGIAATGDRPQELLDAAMKLLSQALRDGHEAIREIVRKESPKWLPLGIRDMVAERMIGGIDRFLEDLEADRNHPMRKRFDGIVADFIGRLKTSPELMEKAEQLKHDMLGRPIVEEFVASLWDKVRDAAERYRSAPEETSIEPVEAMLAGLVESLKTSPDLRREIDEFVTRIIADLLEKNREEIADLIAETVADWDPQVASERIELAMGPDLQFVRLNGTLVGGAAGLVLFTLWQFLG